MFKKSEFIMEFYAPTISPFWVELIAQKMGPHIWEKEGYGMASANNANGGILKTSTWVHAYMDHHFEISRLQSCVLKRLMACCI